jgi:hypothetical protein
MRRSGITIGLLSLSLLVGVAVTGSLAQTASLPQAASGPGPYYATPAWDQKLAPVDRFVVLTDWNSQAVLDKETGLVWERSPESGVFNWSGAARYCLLKNVAGTRGWRLPSVHELASLVDPAQGSPALPPGHPFLTVPLSNVHWSATTEAGNPPISVWALNFNNGQVFIGGKAGTAFVWCARGGMNADAY